MNIHSIQTDMRNITNIHYVGKSEKENVYVNVEISCQNSSSTLDVCSPIAFRVQSSRILSTKTFQMGGGR